MSENTEQTIADLQYRVNALVWLVDTLVTDQINNQLTPEKLRDISKHLMELSID